MYHLRSIDKNRLDFPFNTFFIFSITILQYHSFQNDNKKLELSIVNFQNMGNFRLVKGNIATVFLSLKRTGDINGGGGGGERGYEWEWVQTCTLK